MKIRIHRDCHAGARKRCSGYMESGPLFAQGIAWDLGDLYSGPADPRLREDVKTASGEASALAERFRGRIERGDVSADELAEALRSYERVVEIGSRPGFYASLLFAADTQNREAQALEAWAREAWTEIHEKILFVDLELRRLPATLYEASSSHGELGRYRHHLEIARRHQPHTLSEPEEKILSRKDLTSRGAFVQLWGELAGSLRFEIEIDGERKILTDGEMMALQHHPDRNLRRRALESFLGTWRTQELVLTSILNNLLLDHRIDTSLRRFPSAIAPRHLDNDVEPAMIDAMMAAVERHYPDVQEYFRLKARLLGIDSMAVTDLHAPLGDRGGAIPFDDARALVLDAFGAFSDRFADLARRFFEERWIDAEIRPSKRGGAFCASHSPAHHPYVLASYAGTPRDVSTIAHELGHGVHALLSAEQPLVAFDAPLVLAETASVFAEMLLVEHWLARAKSADTRAAILCDALDEIYGTVFRQNALTRFELLAHEARRTRRVDGDELGSLWMDAQRPLFGDAVSIPEIYRFGWTYIPHFVHTPFYCYAYSFGELLVLALFEHYRAQGPDFVPGFLRLLEAGGGDSPARLLAAIGIDLTDPGFWESGFRGFRRFLDELNRAVPAESR